MVDYIKFNDMFLTTRRSSRLGRYEMFLFRAGFPPVDSGRSVDLNGVYPIVSDRDSAGQEHNMNGKERVGPRHFSRRIHILLAEDNEAYQIIVAAQLRRIGMEPVVVGDGAKAVAAVTSREFELVLMDVRMPVMDGLEAARRIRAFEKPEGRRLPILAMINYSFAGDLLDSIRADMDDQLIKPVDMAQLTRALNTWIVRRR